MKNNDNINPYHICIGGMNFYIIWKNENDGYDQWGTKWINKKEPVCTNQEMVNICLDTYNNIMALNK